MSELKRRLAMNAERRMREQMIPGLPDSLRRLLQTASAKYSRELYSSLTCSPFPKFEQGQLVTRERFDLYWHVEYDRIEHVQRVLVESTIKFAAPVAISLGEGPVYLVREPVTAGHVCDWVSCLKSRVTGRIFVLDSVQGLIIESYSGFLPDGRSTSQDEVVYEMTYYQDEEQVRTLDALLGASDL